MSNFFTLVFIGLIFWVVAAIITTIVMISIYSKAVERHGAKEATKGILLATIFYLLVFFLLH